MADEDEPSLTGFHYNRRLGCGKTLQLFRHKEVDFALLSPLSFIRMAGLSGGSCDASAR
ncbi:hypothetical protein F385_918 [Pantoea agglomerans 299R]|nr:hypothetical protein F385_918 [Pantoea agglomerans 299R]